MKLGFHKVLTCWILQVDGVVKNRLIDAFIDDYLAFFRDIRARWRLFGCEIGNGYVLVLRIWQRFDQLSQRRLHHLRFASTFLTSSHILQQNLPLDSFISYTALLVKRLDQFAIAKHLLGRCDRVLGVRRP